MHLQSFLSHRTNIFAPFISPCHNPKLKGKEIRELLPENNENINLVPQIMANNPEYFIKGAKQLQENGL